MSAIRQRAALIARQARPTLPRNARSYASESHGSDHGHHHAAPVEESLGKAPWIILAAIGGSTVVYSISRPRKDGEPNRITKIWDRFAYQKEQWETRNHLRTRMYEQAAHDKHLLYNVPKNSHIELSYPEVFQHGCQQNVPAGHYPNIDKVIAHYRQQHLDEEDRKVKKLAAAAAAKEQQ